MFAQSCLTKSRLISAIIGVRAILPAGWPTELGAPEGIRT